MHPTIVHRPGGDFVKLFAPDADIAQRGRQA
jgi:hypothetical protein